MRTPRMTTRRWMTLMIVAGIALGGWIQLGRWRMLRELYEVQAEFHQDSAAHFRQFAERTHEEWLSDCRAVDERNRRRPLRLGWQLLHPPDPATARRWVDHFSLLSRKYQRASAFPWLPVEPDPPMPK